MRRRPSSWLALPVVAVFLLVLAVGLGTRRGAGRQASAPPASPPGVSALPRLEEGPAGSPSKRKTKRPKRDPLAALEDPARAWAAVDLDAMRAVLPSNLYWTMSFPTKDPEVLRQREEERARWNMEYGKVLSNTATDEEIDAYYAHRQRLSADYVAFAGYLLLTYRDQLPKRDVALLKLAMDMHLAQLEEIPRQIVEAHERHRAHDAARRAWLEDQKAFEGDPAAR